MSSPNTASSSNVYNFTPGDWTWGATDPSENREVKLNTPCLGYHPSADTNEDNVLLLLDQSYNNNQDIVPLPEKKKFHLSVEVRDLAYLMGEFTNGFLIDQCLDYQGHARWSFHQSAL